MDAATTEKVRQLRAQGYSEAEALRKVNVRDEESDETTEVSADEPVTEDDGMDTSDRLFVIYTRDFSGLGWAAKLQQEGERVIVATEFKEDDPKLLKMKKQVGENWLEVVPVKDAVRTYRGDNVYHVFAENQFVDVAKQLIAAGEKVFPPGIELGDKMEHDREYAMTVVEEAGLEAMPHYEFESKEEGVAFLDENADKAYVFKPDDAKGSNFTTFVPVRKKDEDANRELYEYLAHMKQEPGAYILQERIPLEDSLEVNCECWFYEGQPFLANVGLEVKRKDTYDLGEMCGCAGDFCQFIPLDCKLVQQTIGLLFPFYEEQKYTGFADVNVIFTKDGTPHFLEVCNRFGYNSHPNMLIALLKGNVGDLLADFVDGHIEDFPSRFETGVGGSLTFFIDHPRPGLPVHVDDAALFYPFDGYREDEQLLLTGYSDEIGILVDKGKDIASLAQSMAENVAQKEYVSAPDMHYRWDLWETNYYNAPVLRMKALKDRGLL